MMKGLVTVGTTPFDSLIQALDKPSEQVSLKFQIASGSYEPKFHKFERFIPDLKSQLDSFDFVVTHAGAGSVYNLLEANRKFVVVANTERSDNHQLELSKFIGDQHYAPVFSVEDLNSMSLKDLYDHISQFSPVVYQKEPFYKGLEIIEFIQGKG